MRKLKKAKNTKELQEQRKMNKVYSFVRVHSKIYNLTFFLEKALIKHLELWNKIIAEDGFLEEEQYNLLEFSIKEIKSINETYKKNGFEIINETQIEIDEILTEIIKDYETDENFTELEQELVKSLLTVLNVVLAIRESFTYIEKGKKELTDILNALQEYLNFFRNEIDSCKLSTKIKRKKRKNE